MKLYLLRHGQTLWNVEGKIQGKTDIPLNETGVRQAKLLAKAIERYEIGEVYSSPLKRALQTAELLAGQKGLAVRTAKQLEEVDFGLWEGLGWEEVAAAYPEQYAGWAKDPTLWPPNGGETRESCQRRCREILDQITARPKGDTAIVAHGGILAYVIEYLLRNQEEKQEIIVKNASISTVEYDGTSGLGRLLQLNDTSHLPASPRGKTNKYC